MNLVICNLVLAFIAITLSKTTLAYSNFPTDINDNYLNVRNSALPMTTSHPHTNPPLGRYILPPREFLGADEDEDEDQKSSDYEQYSENRAIPRDRSYLIRLIRRRVPRDQTPQQLNPQGRSLSGVHWGQGDDNHLGSDAGVDVSHDNPSDQLGKLRAWNGRIPDQNAVEGLRKYNITRTRELNKMIEAHKQLMAMEGVCRVPRPEVVHIMRETNTFYTPHATILHRCSDKVGCCEAGWTCQMKKNETVELVFAKVEGRFSEPIIKPMENHTECGCVKVETRRKRSPVCLCPKHFKDFSWTGSREEHLEVGLWERRERREQRCRCDCHLSDDTCKRLKNGVEGFSVMERRRIQSGEVSPPFCNYGAYDVKNGRCPRPGQNPTRNPNLQPYLRSGRQNSKS
ncbi:uncharacterized protein LOC6541829 [Drosophila erecta]|nr:uncharacterized protein LOC6541829 [Drosophila erecta]XP_026835146.1 uncharacterized protein LOC6541829 [Drosophila erecta]XP_026835147.1 uncharacterized protein LOC6541829 [Drosophila erecta]